MHIELHSDNDVCKVDCSEFEAWEDGDKLLRYLKNKFHAVVDDYSEGPDARRWFVVVEGQQLSVDQSDLGFLSIAAKGAGAQDVVRRIAHDLQTLTKADWARATETRLARLWKAFKLRSLRNPSLEI